MLQLPTLMQGAEPFFFRGGSTGCLCLHGFTANPSEMRWLGEHLAREGMTVYGARLAGHGTHPHDLARCHWHDWVTSALDGYYLLKAQCDRVVVVGHSMGGVLALALATQVELGGVAVLAAPIRFPNRLAYARWLRYVRPFSDQSDSSPVQAIVQAEQAQRGEPVIGRIRYDVWSTAAVWQLYDLVQTVAQKLREVRAPVFLLYSRADSTAPARNGDIIAAQVGSADIEHHVLDHSGHIMTQDIERETVFALVGGFVQRCAASATSEDISA